MKMKISKWPLVLAVLVLLCAICLTPMSADVADANDTSYYIDCSVGSNGSGTLSSPWNTLASVNSHAAFQPGDHILLKRGTTCSGQLHPLGSGSSGSPITIDAYGSGSDYPLISGGGINGGAVYLLNQQYWVIQNLEVTNTAASKDLMRYGILAMDDGGGLLSYIHILNNYVHAVSGTFSGVGSGFNANTDPAHEGGISVYTKGINDRFDDVLVEGNSSEDNGRQGIAVWDSHWVDGAGGVTNAITNLIVRNNVVKDLDGDGILVFGTKGALIERNVSSGANRSTSSSGNICNIGIWPTRAYDTVMQYNESYDTKAGAGGCDSEGYDVDLSSVNTTVQYNYSHDNYGGFILICGGQDQAGSPYSDGVVVRYNISQNDGVHGIGFSCSAVAPNINIYNNTMFKDASHSGRMIDAYCCTSSTVPYTVKNNIFYVLSSADYNLPGTGGTFDYNVFYGNHPGNEPSDSHKLTSNPELADAGGGGIGIDTVDGYMLTTDSPLLSSGNYGALISANGGADYWGNPVSSSSASVRGAYNGSGVTPTSPPAGVYQASDGFSSTQGSNGWSYQSWNGSSYSNMTWDSANNRWAVSGTYSIIGSDWQHADATDSARKFTVPAAGSVQITGQIYKTDISGGDGVNVKIMKNSTQIWPASGWQAIAYNDSTGVSVNVTTNVSVGDAIYFVMNKNGTNGNDTTHWDPVISYGGSASAGFSSTQGSNGWSYQSWNGSSYSDMTWDSANNRWEVSGTYSLIGPDWQHADGTDSARKYTVPTTGTIHITGQVYKTDISGGDGVNVKIMKNSTQIWPASGWQAIAYNDSTGVSVDVSAAVTAGDAIYFVMNKNGTNGNDTTHWDPLITIEDSGGGIVSNPGFETGSLSPWTVGGTVVASNAHTGTYALRMSGSSTGALQTITVSPNTTYTLSGYLKSLDGNSVYIGVKDYGGAETNNNTTSSVMSPNR